MTIKTEIAEHEMADHLVLLLSKIATGDEQALSQFYHLSVNRVYGLASRITGTPETAEEVVGDVYLQVWNSAVKFDSERGNAITWLLMICRSRSLDALRRVKNLKNWVNMDEFLIDSRDAIEPFDLLVTLDSKSEIHTALMCLSESKRQLISLAYFRGYSHQQLARFTALPLGTVKTELRQAKKHLSSFMNLAAIKPQEVS